MDPEWDEDVECCFICVVHELPPKRAIWRVIRVPREHDQQDHVQENDVVDPDEADPQRNQRRQADEPRVGEGIEAGDAEDHEGARPNPRRPCELLEHPV